MVAVPGHRGTLQCLAAVAHDTSGATLALTAAVAAFPFEAAGFDPQPDAAEAREIREHRHREARGIVHDALDRAAHTMNVCEIACMYTATALTQRTAAAHRAPSTNPGARPQAAPATATAARPKLSAPQKAALRAIAAGGVTMRENGRMGRWLISGGNGGRITMPTYEALEVRRLVSRDTSTSLHHGQKLDATDAGRAALAALAPTTATAGPTLPASAARHR